MSVAYSIPRLPEQLKQLTDQVQAITERHGRDAHPPGVTGRVATGWGEDHEPAAALERGVLHEWFGATPAASTLPRRPEPAAPLPLWEATGAPMHRLSLASAAGDLPSMSPAADRPNRLVLPIGGQRKARIEHPKSSTWAPPLSILAHLARRGLQSMPQGWVIWIGKRVWPYPHLLLRGEDGPRLLERSVWIDAPTAAERLWAIDQAVRCPAISVVVADGRAFNMSATRRLQLAARAGSSLLLVARPPGEMSELSAASTRWAVHAEVSTNKNPRWSVELLRCKHAAQASTMARRSWVVELDRAQGHVRAAAHLVGRPAASTPQRQTA